MPATDLSVAKSELFKTLGHPARIRVLELLQDGARPVRELLERSTSRRPTCPSSSACCAGRDWSAPRGTAPR